MASMAHQAPTNHLKGYSRSLGDNAALCSRTQNDSTVEQRFSHLCSLAGGVADQLMGWGAAGVGLGLGQTEGWL